MISIAKVIINIDLEIKIDKWTNNRYCRSKHRCLNSLSAVFFSSARARDFIMMLSWTWSHESLCERLLRSDSHIDRSLSQAILKMSMKTIIRVESFMTATTTWYILRRDVQSQQLIISRIFLIDTRVSILIIVSLNVVVLLIIIIEAFCKVIMIDCNFLLFNLVCYVSFSLVKSIVESFCVWLIDLLIRWLLSRIERVWVFEDNS